MTFQIQVWFNIKGEKDNTTAMAAKTSCHPLKGICCLSILITIPHHLLTFCQMQANSLGVELLISNYYIQFQM